MKTPQETIVDCFNTAGLMATSTDAVCNCIETSTYDAPVVNIPDVIYRWVTVGKPSSTGGNPAKTVKIQNAFFNLKKFFTLTLNTASSTVSIITAPHLFVLHGLRLIVALKKDITIELSDGEGKIVYVLYKVVGFQRPIVEYKLYDRLSKYLKENGLQPITESDFERANSHLAALGVIDIKEGAIILIEKTKIS